MRTEDDDATNIQFKGIPRMLKRQRPIINFQDVSDGKATDSLVYCIRSGYARIRMPAPTADNIRKLQENMTIWFSSSPEEKNQFSLEKNQWIWGYFDKKQELGKELLQIRMHKNADTSAWPAEFEQMKLLWTRVHADLKQIAQMCLHRIGEFVCRPGDARGPDAPVLRCDPSALEKWDELSPFPSSSEFCPDDVSKLDIFHYARAPAPDCRSCGEHCDSGILTVVPQQLGGAGLEVFDWEACEFVKCEEENAEEHGIAVVFGGEALFRATNHYILPATHRVEVSQYPRFSCPFLLYPEMNSVFSSSILNERIVGPRAASLQDGQSARAYVASLRGSLKASVTYSVDEKKMYDDAIFGLATKQSPHP